MFVSRRGSSPTSEVSEISSIPFVDDELGMTGGDSEIGLLERLQEEDDENESIDYKK